MFRFKINRVQQPDTSKPILSTPNDTTISNALEPAPEKIHIRGLDNLTTADIDAFATEHFPEAQRKRVEWIDDDSANIVYESADVASQALQAFAAVPADDMANTAALQLLLAKKLSTQPNVTFRVRLAVLGDKKMAGARDRSRFYLWNPEYDTKDRRVREGGNRYRDRGDGGYRSRRYDDRENEKRGQVDISMGLDASMYDDDESALAKRATQGTRREYSPRRESRNDSRRRDRGRDRRDRELFPDQDVEEGRLRNRSASPARENEWESKGDDTEMLERKRDMAAAANRQKAQLLKAKLRDNDRSKELFPDKVGSPSRHRRSDAFDAADGTADLFSSRITIASESGVSRPLASRVTSRNPTMNGASSFSIRGAARPSQAQSFSIKGAANGDSKELFPEILNGGGNAGKELFSRTESRNRKRQTAGDLFE